MALGAWGNGDSRSTVFPDVVWNSQESALVSQEGTSGRSKNRVADDGRGELRARTSGNRRLDSCRRNAGRREALLSDTSLSHLPGREHRDV